MGDPNKTLTGRLRVHLNVVPDSKDARRTTAALSHVPTRWEGSAVLLVSARYTVTLMLLPPGSDSPITYDTHIHTHTNDDDAAAVARTTHNNP
ncbi:hypothetical protein ACI65C_005543 [Semiaphis heraclei]